MHMEEVRFLVVLCGVVIFLSWWSGVLCEMFTFLGLYYCRVQCRLFAIQVAKIWLEQIQPWLNVEECRLTDRHITTVVDVTGRPLC